MCESTAARLSECLCLELVVARLFPVAALLLAVISSAALISQLSSLFSTATASLPHISLSFYFLSLLLRSSPLSLPLFSPPPEALSFLIPPLPSPPPYMLLSNHCLFTLSLSHHSALVQRLHQPVIENSWRGRSEMRSGVTVELPSWASAQTVPAVQSN